MIHNNKRYPPYCMFLTSDNPIHIVMMLRMFTGTKMFFFTLDSGVTVQHCNSILRSIYITLKPYQKQKVYKLHNN